MYGEQFSLILYISLEGKKDDINIMILSFLCATLCKCVKRWMEIVLGVVYWKMVEGSVDSNGLFFKNVYCLLWK
jgi:hypothetical protein